jgi:hypothetical protein
MGVDTEAESLKNGRNTGHLAERVGFEPLESAVDKTCAGLAVAEHQDSLFRSWLWSREAHESNC